MHLQKETMMIGLHFFKRKVLIHHDEYFNRHILDVAQKHDMKLTEFHNFELYHKGAYVYLCE